MAAHEIAADANSKASAGSSLASGPPPGMNALIFSAKDSGLPAGMSSTEHAYRKKSPESISQLRYSNQQPTIESEGGGDDDAIVANELV